MGENIKKDERNLSPASREVPFGSANIDLSPSREVAIVDPSMPNLPKDKSPAFSDSYSDLNSSIIDELLFPGLPFLKFPPEIRNRVYEFLFVSPIYIGSEGASTKSFYKDASRWRNLTFAKSCRQMYNESGDIFYAKNGFEFFYIRPFLEFMEAIGIQRRRILTKLKYHCSNGRPFIALRYVRSCTSLRELEVSARVVMKNKKNSWWSYPVENPLKVFLTASSDPIIIGSKQGFGKAITTNEEPSKENVEKSRAALTRALEQVKKEASGLYRRYVRSFRSTVL